jgi:hypothetical protein
MKHHYTYPEICAKFCVIILLAFRGILRERENSRNSDKILPISNVLMAVKRLATKHSSLFKVCHYRKTMKYLRTIDLIKDGNYELCVL